VISDQWSVIREAIDHEPEDNGWAAALRESAESGEEQGTSELITDL
jgi:hypothetical protein